MGWIVATTKPQSEQRARDHVSRQGHGCYLPMLSEEVTRAGRRERIVRPMFPRYLFVETDGPWRHLAGTIGVSGVVMSGDGPARLERSVVDELRGREQGGVVVLPARRFAVGQRVRATRGALAGRVGFYQGQTSLEREVALFEILGRETPVSVGVGCLEAA